MAEWEGEGEDLGGLGWESKRQVDWRHVELKMLGRRWIIHLNLKNILVNSFFSLYNFFATTLLYKFPLYGVCLVNNLVYHLFITIFCLVVE